MLNMTLQHIRLVQLVIGLMIVLVIVIAILQNKSHNSNNLGKKLGKHNTGLLNNKIQAYILNKQTYSGIQHIHLCICFDGRHHLNPMSLIYIASQNSQD